LNELLDIVDVSLELSDSLLDPLFRLVVPLLDLDGNELVDLLDVLLGGWLDLGSGALAVKLDEPDLGCLRDLRAKELVVVVE